MFTVSVDVLMRVHWSVKMIDTNMELISNIRIYEQHFLVKQNINTMWLVGKPWIFCFDFYSLY